MKKKGILLFILLITLITFVNAEVIIGEDEFSGVNIKIPEVTFNNGTAYVNSSEHWITAEGTLNNVADIILSWITPSSFDMTGYTLTTSYLAGIIGNIDMRGDPWYLSGTDMEFNQDVDINKNLNVDGNITAGGLNITDTFARFSGNIENDRGSLGYANIEIGEDIYPTMIFDDGLDTWMIDFLTGAGLRFYQSGDVHMIVDTTGITTDENVTADYFHGDGSQLTNIPIQDYWVNETGDTMTGSLILNDSEVKIQDAEGDIKMYFENDYLVVEG